MEIFQTVSYHTDGELGHGIFTSKSGDGRKQQKNNMGICVGRSCIEAIWHAQF